MSQKIYSDRTELEGVDLPGEGQTKMLVIDENKNIKSEAKPTLDVEPTTGTVPVRYGLGEGRVKVGDGANSKDAINKGQLDAALAKKMTIVSIEVTLDKSQINNLHTTPVVIPASAFGFTNPDQVAKIIANLCEFEVYNDGVPFSGASSITLINTANTNTVLNVPATVYLDTSGNIFTGFVPASSYVLDSAFQIIAGSAITGGGSAARMTFRIFFQERIIS